MVPRPSRLTTWCRLLRLPNLFTVPGDPLAGFLLATGGVLDWRVAGAMAASLLLYCAGLLLNDYFDRETDARERPERPIPSGAVSAPAVLMAGAMLLLAGVLTARVVGGESAGWAAALVAACVLGYNGALKQRRVAGPLVMGACRAGSVLIGTACAAGLDNLAKLLAGWMPWRSLSPLDEGLPGATAALIAAATAWVYTAAVTALARSEAGGRRPGRAAYLPGLALLAGGMAMLRCSRWRRPYLLCTTMCWDSSTGGGQVTTIDRAGVLAVGLVAIAVIEAGVSAIRVRRGTIAAPAFIGRLIRVMITTQAAWVTWTFGPCLGHKAVFAVLPAVLAAWLALRVVAALSARRFYGS
ncbi:MAG TPA: UbiA family prenyltransferase [Planctomycetota bacterium]|nr:UbiA family prenyltransferase [Planctomycetota bacterium]HRR79549.1 UbiA family prenyltransferase [Planctomycetota bacterium]HRT96065.1 UbiA family prenyltransferase [Planctomycetota bacterium]